MPFKLLNQQVSSAIEISGKSNLDKLLAGNETWTLKYNPAKNLQAAGTRACNASYEQSIQLLFTKEIKLCEPYLQSHY